MKQLNLKMLEKKLEKKNAELVEVRDFRKKLDDKEKKFARLSKKFRIRKSK